MTEKPYKPKCLSAITKNLNWRVLTQNLVTFKRQDGLKLKNVEGRGVTKKQYIWGIA